MNFKVLLLSLLSLCSFAVENNRFYKVDRIQYEGLISTGEGARKTYIGIYSLDIEGQEIHGYEYTTWGRRLLDKNNLYYVKFDDRRESQPTYYNAVLQDQGEGKDIRYMAEFIPSSEVVTIEGEVKKCKVRYGMPSVQVKRFCVKNFYFSDNKMRDLLGKNVRITLQKDIVNSPCWLASSILYPRQCSRKPVREIISIESL